jgi:hypothetical protein
MIKMLTAYTDELSDAEKAVRDIHRQLDIKNSLLKNSSALIFCYGKFIETGVMKAVCESLPFDVLGCTSQYFALSALADKSAVDKSAGAGEIMLTVTVLTSDDTEFATGISEPLCAENAETVIQSFYRDTVASFREAPSPEPSLIFAFQPTMLGLCGDAMTRALDRVCGGIPVFGAVALDYDTDIRDPKTIYRGAAYGDRMALLLFKGPVKPRFFSSSIPEKYIIDQDAVITAAGGNRIISINNEPAVAFIKKLGIFQSDKQAVNPSIPLIIEGRNGAGPLAVVMQGTAPQGELICDNLMQTGDSLNIGMVSADYVMESAASLVQDIKNSSGGENLLMFSCFLRSILLGGSHGEEIELIRKELEGFSGPYLFFDSAGEICPRYTETGETLNQISASALIACQF